MAEEDSVGLIKNLIKDVNLSECDMRFNFIKLADKCQKFCVVQLVSN